MSSTAYVVAQPIATNLPHRRANILFVTDQLCAAGGAEKMLMDTISHLPQDRFRCELVTFKHDTRITLFQNPPCPIHVFPLHRTYDLNALHVAWRLRSFIHDHQIDIVHTSHETSDLWAGLIVKLSTRSAVISSRRDMGFQRTRKHDVAYRYFGRHFDRVLTVSDRVRAHCIEAESLDPGKVITIHNGLDLSQLDDERTKAIANSALGVDDDSLRITTVGNLRWIKGTDVLIQAAAIVCREYPKAAFLIVGDPLEADYFEDLKKLVKALALEANIHFLGARGDVYSILKASDIFCLPSRSEGFSNALLEAMACGLPTVATDVGGNREAILDGANGFLVNPEDPVRLAERLLELLRSRVRAAAMGQAARQTVEAHFTLEATMSKLVQIYDELIHA